MGISITAGEHLSIWIGAGPFPGTLGAMRLIATAVVCVLAAFGAAFLLGRAANDHQGSATAATVTTVRAATRVSTPVTRTHPDRALAAQFEPGLRGLRHRRRVRPRRVHPRRVHHVAPVAPLPAAVVPSAPTTTSYATPAPTPAPAPTPSPAPTHTSPTHHRSGGSGTTTIG